MFFISVKTMLETATSKALATSGPSDINVVPVSMIKVPDTADSLWLFDFFMEKTIANIKIHSKVALTAWTDLKGIQLKATAEYVNSGPDFDAAEAWVKTQNPHRVTKGLIILKPYAIFDISPGGVFSSDDLVF